MDAKLHSKLSKRRLEGTLRSLSSFEGEIDFFSNDYLGWAAKRMHLNVSLGSSGSRLLSGNSEKHERVESQFATYFGSEDALHFNSGYDANLGIFSTIPQKGDTVLYDAMIHASVRDGIRLSFAKSHAFRHNDLTHLKERLEKAEGTVYVAVEALYSMDGDIAPLKDIVAITTLYGAHLIVDEAHSAGVFGPKGKGLVSALGLEDDIFLRLITFGKAFGSHGAVLLCSSDVKRYMINFCRPFIYSTALPAFIVEHNWSVVSDDSWQQKRKALEYVIRSFRDGYSGYSPSHPESPIQMVYFEGVDRVKSKVEDLQKSGIAVKAIFPPTVPEGKACIRLCMHAFNTEEEIDQLVQLLTA